MISLSQTNTMSGDVESLIVNNSSGNGNVSNKSKGNEEAVFTWKVTDFQDYHNRMTCGTFMLSERFNSSCIDNTGTKKFIYYWRLQLYPHGYSACPDSLAIFLTAFPSQYEKQISTKSRIVQKFWFELYKLEIGNENSAGTSSGGSVSGGLTHLSTRSFKKSTFNFEANEEGRTLGTRRFCSFKEIFPENNTYKQLTLVIRVYITNEGNIEKNFSNNLDPIPSQTSLSPFVSSFEKFYGDQRFHDVEFSFECGSILKANRFALSSRSTYFDSFFTNEWAEAKTTPIPIKGMKVKSFQAIIYYLYTGRIEGDLSLDTLENLHAEASTFLIEELREKINNRIGEMIDMFNWDGILKFSLKVGNENLKKGVLDFIAENWDEVKQTKQMKRMLKNESLDWISVIEELVTTKLFSVSK